MKLTYFLPAVLVMSMLASCGGDKKEIDNPGGPQGSGSMTEMTPEESKEYLQETAAEFLNKFKPEDQRQAVELAAYFSSEFEYFDAPEEFEIEPNESKRTPAAYLKALSDAARGDMDALTRAATSYSYTVNFNKLSGIYEPNYAKEKWVKTSDSKDIVFQFKNKSGQPVVLTVAQSGGEYDVDFSIDEWDEDYVNGHWEEFKVKYQYFLSVPKTVKATLTENGKQLADSEVVSSIDTKKHTISADVKANLMNLKATTIVEGTDSKVEARSEFYISGDWVAEGYATVTGRDLCNIDKYTSMADMDEEEAETEWAKMFKTGDCGANVLDKVQVYAQIEYYKNLPIDLGDYYDSYDYDNNKDAARKDCEQACDRLNQHIKSQVRYNKTKTDQASFKFVPYFYDYSYGYYDEWEYVVSADVLFPDGTTYDVASYFENFTNVARKWNSLLKAYQNIWEVAGGIEW